MAEYVTLEHRALLQAGTWNASTGTEAITDEDLAEIVRAHESGVLDNPVVKIGHVDARFNTYLEDGTPAYGQITNLSIEDGVLFGDYVNFPSELAEAIDSAYPHSSVELARNVVLRDQEGNVVHEFGCVLTANALLGATAPAVKGLSTKMSAVAALSSGSPTYVEIRAAQFSLPGGNTARDLADKLSGAIDSAHSSDAVWAYLEDFTDEKVIFTVEGYGEAVHYEQAYTIDSGSAAPVLSGEPVQVVKETRWVKENTGDTPTVQPQPNETAQAMSEDPKNPASPDTQGDTTMAVDKEKAGELRKQYGLDPKASTDDLLNAIIAEKDKKDVAPGTDETPNAERVEQQRQELENNPNFAEGEGEDDGDEDEDTRGAGTEDEDDEEDEDGGEEVPGGETAGGDNIPASTETRRDLKTGRKKVGVKSAKVAPKLLSEMQSRLSAAESRLAAREAAETKARRDGYVREWYHTGLISDDECERVRAKLDRDEELTVELITDRVPAFYSEEKGHSEPTIFAASQTSAVQSEYEADDAVFGTSK